MPYVAEILQMKRRRYLIKVFSAIIFKSKSMRKQSPYSVCVCVKNFSRKLRLQLSVRDVDEVVRDGEAWGGNYSNDTRG